MSAETKPKQFRIYRRVFTGIHMVVAVVFGSLLAAGVWGGISEIRPARKLAPLSAAACVERAAALHDELLARLGSFPHADSAAAEGAAFEQWSVAYRARLLEARARCKKPEGGSPDQARAAQKAFGAVIRTLDLSAITATHWARHLGPSLDDAAGAIEEARQIR
ncbi:hypothetical protein [Vulgatibacter sp.]|uniref:hypothetical protein n=1 Tax=Vulgatibacter sp. TaxID=1971226 RepID=UPI003564256A